MSFWEAFWDVIWWFLLVSVFITYFITLFGVIGDIFRDRELHGGFKALWMILLIFVPILTMLIYLIFRGNGMAERSRQRAIEEQNESESYIREVASRTAPSPAGEITRAKSLLDAGTITTDEYSSLKAQALQGPRMA
jgi:hypothetical protein